MRARARVFVERLNDPQRLTFAGLLLSLPLALLAALLHRLSASLRSASAYRRAVFDYAVDGIMMIDEAGTIHSFNPAAERMTGWSGGNALGKKLDSVLTLVAEATGAAIANPVGRCLDSGEVAFLEDDAVLVGRDGGRRDIRSSAAPLRLPVMGAAAGARFEIVTPPKHGTLTGSGAERTYTPATGFTGRDRFEWRAGDSNLAAVEVVANASGVNTAPRASSTPQWPWSVNSSRQQSDISTVLSPSSARRSARATLRMPSGSVAPEPTASRSAGTPNSMMPPTPACKALPTRRPC